MDGSAQIAASAKVSPATRRQSKATASAPKKACATPEPGDYHEDSDQWVPRGDALHLWCLRSDLTDPAIAAYYAASSNA